MSLNYGPRGFTRDILLTLYDMGYILEKDWERYREHKSLVIQFGPVPFKVFSNDIVPMLPEENLSDGHNFAPTIKEVLEMGYPYCQAVGGYIVLRDEDERISLDTVWYDDDRQIAIEGWVRGGDEVWYDTIDGAPTIGVWYD